MNSTHHAQAVGTMQPRRASWFILLLFSLIFFLSNHQIVGGPRASGDVNDAGNYNASQEDIASTTSSPIRQVTLIVLGVFAGASLLNYPSRRLRREGVLAPFLIGYATWALTSIFWAEDVSLTLKRLVTLALLCLIATAVVRRFSLRAIILWTFFTTLLYLCLGIAFEIIHGLFSPFGSDYRFGGCQHPNAEAVECALLVLSGVAAAQGAERRRRLFWVGALIGFGFLILTASRTALVSTLLALGTYLAIGTSRRVRVRIVPSLALLLCFSLLLAAAGVIPALEKALLLGRDDPGSVESFTGRTEIWQDVTPYILQRPVLGYGYGGFWTPNHINEISDEEQWGVPNSHSAYFDCLLMLGGVGLALYLLCLFSALWRAVALCMNEPNVHGAFLVGSVVFCITEGVCESAINEGTLLTLLCIITLVWLAFLPLEEASSKLLARPRKARAGIIALWK